MSEKEKKIIRDLADKLPTMTERERGYLEGTIATAAAMSNHSTDAHITWTWALVKLLSVQRKCTC